MPVINQLGIYSNGTVIIPAITSSIFLTIGIEALAFLPVLQEAEFSEAATSKWFKHYFFNGLIPIISLGTVSTVTGALAYKQGHGKLFGYGALFSALHFAYVPIIMYPCQYMIENKQTKEALRKWIRIHRFRLVSDMAATVCFTTALYKYITK